MSSGNIGKSIITAKLYFALLKNLTHFSQLSSPTINTTNFLPNVWPSINATALPSKIPAKLNKAPCNGPNTIAPAIVKIVEGIGIKVTCKNCKNKNPALPQKPSPEIKSLNFSTELSFSQTPVNNRTKYPPIITTANIKATNKLLKIFLFKLIFLCNYYSIH